MPLFFTLALGKNYVRMAEHLADDLRDFGHDILVLTDAPASFRRRSNVLVREFHPPHFHFNLKCDAYRAAIEESETVIWLDSDTVVSEAIPAATIAQELSVQFPPGLHVWKTFPAGADPRPHIEQEARSLGLHFDPDAITYQERLCALTCDGNEQRFLDTWQKLGDHLDALRLPHVNDGTPMAIAACDSGIKRHGSGCFDETRLAEIFCPMRHRYPLGLNLRPLRKLRARRRGWPARVTS